MKSEKEKMLAGELYFAGDDELEKGRIAARALFLEFNSIKPTEIKKKSPISIEGMRTMFFPNKAF